MKLRQITNPIHSVVCSNYSVCRGELRYPEKWMIGRLFKPLCQSMAWNMTVLILIYYPHDYEDCAGWQLIFKGLVQRTTVFAGLCFLFRYLEARVDKAWWEFLRINYLDDTSIALQETIVHDWWPNLVYSILGFFQFAACFVFQYWP